MDLARVGVVVARYETIPYEPIERRVNLPNVQRPRATRPVLEVLAKFVAVAVSLAEEGEQ